VATKFITIPVNIGYLIDVRLYKLYLNNLKSNKYSNIKYVK